LKVSSFWATDDGWPYADTVDEIVEVGDEPDDDRLSLGVSAHLWDGLNPLEHQVLSGRYGLNGNPVLSMKQLQISTGLPRGELRDALGSGLAKLRINLGVHSPPTRRA